MKILLNNNDLNEALNKVSNLGFVPTMGCLHMGHISLIKRSKKECKKTIVSIFVNPAQFNNKNDYIKYPRNIKKDLSILRKLNVNFVFLPKKREIYNSFKKIKIPQKDKILCAKYRKGHFEGVIGIMDRFTEIIKPNKIFMGEKDFQQLFMVRNYLRKKYHSKIISCETIRDKDKLPLSSRNLHLDNKDLQTARLISNNLSNFKKQIIKEKNIRHAISLIKKKINNFKNVKVEYLDLRNKFTLKKSSQVKNSKIFIAYYIKKIRLIDNF